MGDDSRSKGCALQVRQDVACNAFISIAGLDRILPLRLVRRVEVVLPRDPQVVQRDAPANLRRIHVRCRSLSDVSLLRDTKVYFSLARGVVVFGPGGGVLGVQWDSILGWHAEYEALMALEHIFPGRDGLVHLVVISGVEMVSVGRAVSIEERRGRLGATAALYRVDVI